MSVPVWVQVEPVGEGTAWPAWVRAEPTGEGATGRGLGAWAHSERPHGMWGHGGR